MSRPLIWVCEEHGSGCVVTYSGSGCPICELQEERDGLETELDAANREMEDVISEANSLKRQLAEANS